MRYTKIDFYDNTYNGDGKIKHLGTLYIKKKSLSTSNFYFEYF